MQTSTTDIDTGVPAGPDNEVAWSFLLQNMSSGLQTELGLPSTGETSTDTSVVWPQVIEAVTALQRHADITEAGTFRLDLPAGPRRELGSIDVEVIHNHRARSLRRCCRAGLHPTP